MQIANWPPLQDHTPRNLHFAVFNFQFAFLWISKRFMRWPSQSVSLDLTSSQTPGQQGCFPAQDLDIRRESGQEQRSFPSLRVPGWSRRGSAAHGWWVSHGEY